MSPTRMGRTLATVAVCAGLLLGSSGAAQAWYKVRNNTPNAVWVAHAYASTSGIFCGYNDRCDDQLTKGWRVEGWWSIAPGGTSTIDSRGFGNAMHHLYAHDALGHVWSGGGGSFGTPDTVFNRCEGNFSDLNIPYYTYFKVRTTWCCGGTCPGNGTTTLTL